MELVELTPPHGGLFVASKLKVTVPVPALVLEKLTDNPEPLLETTPVIVKRAAVEGDTAFVEMVVTQLAFTVIT